MGGKKKKEKRTGGGDRPVTGPPQVKRKCRGFDDCPLRVGVILVVKKITIAGKLVGVARGKKKLFIDYFGKSLLAKKENPRKVKSILREGT